MRRALYTIFTFAIINTKRFFRDRLSIFFGILFPLIFLFVFGGIFGNNTASSFNVALINESKSSFATDFVKKLESQKSFRISDTEKTLDAAKQKMVRSQLDAAIVLPADFGEPSANRAPAGSAKVYYTQNNSQAGQTLSAVLDGTFKSLNADITKTVPPFQVESIALKNKSLTSFDYTFAGMLGFALLGMGIFGPVNVFPELKKMGFLRRLSTTPLRVWQYFCATALSQTVVGLISIAVMFVVAVTVFHLRVANSMSYVILVPFLIISILLLLGIGLAIGGWAKNERQAAPLSNIVIFPMMFLSGTFFPRFLMPEWLQSATGWLPLTPIIDGIRYILNEGYSVAQLLPQLGLIAIWIVVIYIIAFRVFRWE